MFNIFNLRSVSFVIDLNLSFFVDFSLEQEWATRIAELQIKVQHLESLYRVKQEDIVALSQYLSQAPNITISNNFLESLSPDSRNVIKNMTKSQKLHSLVRFPSISQSFLPHLIQDPDALRPAYLLSKGRQDVSIVLGIPSVKR